MLKCTLCCVYNATQEMSWPMAIIKRFTRSLHHDSSYRNARH